MNSSLLRDGVGVFGLTLDDRAVERFGLFMDELRRWNRSVNLTAITKPNQIIVKHFIDSISILPQLEQGERILDVGSGAGLPGLAVAIVRDDLEITSLDAVDKKVRFQRHICRLLRLGLVTVQHGRVEQVAAQQPAHYDVVVSRAFRDVDRFIVLAHQLVRPGGRLIAMLAGGATQLSAKTEELCDQIGLRCYKMEQYRLPQDMGERNLVIFQRNHLETR